METDKLTNKIERKPALEHANNFVIEELNGKTVNFKDLPITKTNNFFENNLFSLEIFFCPRLG